MLTAANFTDYIEFEHSEDGNNGSDEESLLFPGGHLPSAASHEDRNLFSVFTDIWKVQAAHLQLQADALI